MELPPEIETIALADGVRMRAQLDRINHLLLDELASVDDRLLRLQLAMRTVNMATAVASAVLMSYLDLPNDHVTARQAGIAIHERLLRMLNNASKNT